MGVRAGLLAYFDAVAAVGIKENYEVHVGDEVFTVTSRAETTEAVSSPDLVVTFEDAQQIVNIRQGRESFSRLVKRGAIKTDGSTVAFEHFQQIYRMNSTPRQLA